MGVAENLTAVRERIAEACARVDRDPAEVRLLPVTKTHPVAVLREAYAAGERAMGENKVQEVVEKATELDDLADLSWSLIGHLQSNKAGVAAELFSEFQALDSVKLARALDRRLQELGRSMDVLIQVNSSAEPQKFGFAPAEAANFAVELTACHSLRVRGLMTLAVFSDDAEAVSACFRRMRDVQTELRQTDAAAGSYDDLSMGMSGDFELAIEHGATTVRVGQAIFGPR